MEYKLIVKNELETIEFAQNMESEKFPNMVICLNGELGSGKTVFTKAFASAMEIKENVTSPTFSIIKEYDGELSLYHMDVYRLEDTGGADLGLEEYFDGEGVSVVEWSQFVADELPAQYLVVKLLKDETDDDKRTLVLEPHGAHYEQLIANL